MIFGFLPIAVMLATTFLIPLVSLKTEKYIIHTTLAGLFLSLLLSISMIPDVLSKGRVVYQMEGWKAPFGISIVFDPLSVFLSVAFIFIVLLAVVFSHKYIKYKKTEYYSLVCLVLVGTLGVINTGDIFNMFVYLEILSVSSYALTAFFKKKESLEAAIKYLIIGSLATSLVLLGIAFIYGVLGTLNMADIAVKVSGTANPVIGTALALIITGMFIKSGLVPFHAWLPDAYQASPSPVTSIFSGVTTNVGMYAVLRLVFTVFNPVSVLLWMLMIVGAISMLGGALLALVQNSLKRLLAYSSISQMGFVAVSVGLGTQTGLSGGVLHIINHSIIKGLLFLCAGFIVYQAKTDNMHEISGKFKFNPVIGYSFIIGALSLVGVPLFNGFVSKWLIYVATFQVSPVLTVLALVSSALTLAYMLRAFYLVFLCNAKPSAKQKKIPLSMQLPLIVLVGIIILLGVFPGFSIDISNLMVQSLNKQQYIGAVLT